MILKDELWGKLGHAIPAKTTGFIILPVLLSYFTTYIQNKSVYKALLNVTNGELKGELLAFACTIAVLQYGRTHLKLQWEWINLVLSVFVVNRRKFTSIMGCSFEQHTQLPSTRTTSAAEMQAPRSSWCLQGALDL